MKYLPLAFLLLTSCSNHLITADGESIEFPETAAWPDSLSIENYSGGGMNPEWSKVFISKDSCYTIHGEGRHQNRYDFSLSSDELNLLFKGLLANNIDKLGTKKLEGIIYDKGSFSISIRLGNKFINIGEGATEGISEYVEGDFMRCYDLISGSANRKIAGRKKICRFIFDPSLKVPALELSIIPMSRDTLAFTDSTHRLKKDAAFRLLPGIQPFQIHLTRRGKVNYTEYVSSIYPEFDLQKDTLVHLAIVNDTMLQLR